METICCILFYLLFVVQNVFSQSNTKCFTPPDFNGVCINLRQCPYLRRLLIHERKNATIVAYLRNSICGYEGRDPKVWCPLNNRNFESVTRQPIDGQLNNNQDKSHHLPSQNVCGRTNSSRIRIVGGNKVELGDWPWVVALGYRYLNISSGNFNWLCSGTLISDRYIITAAHCTVNLENYTLAVAHLGDLNLDPNVNDGAVPIDIPIDRVIIHELFNEIELVNDISLLRLKTAVNFNRLIQPICLPILPEIRTKNLVNMEPFVAGWGTISYHGPSSNNLMDIQIPVIDNTICKRSYASKKNIIDDRVICAGYLKGGKDSCKGDSGGPLMFPNGNQYYLVGVVSYGFKCAEPGYPGVYTRVSSFLDWISHKIDNNLNDK